MGFLRLAALFSQPLGARRGLGRGCHRRTHRPVDDGRECPGRLGRASLRRRTTLLFSAAGVQTVAAVGVGFAGSFELAVAFLLVVAACMGITGPVQQSYLHQVISSERRATVISFHSMMGSTGSAFGQLGLGYLSRAYSISIGYIVGGLVTVTALPLLALLRRLREPEDLIVGTARDRGACAAQGLPNVTAVETAARTS